VCVCVCVCRVVSPLALFSVKQGQARQPTRLTVGAADLCLAIIHLMAQLAFAAIQREYHQQQEQSRADRASSTLSSSSASSPAVREIVATTAHQRAPIKAPQPAKGGVLIQDLGGEEEEDEDDEEGFMEVEEEEEKKEAQRGPAAQLWGELDLVASLLVELKEVRTHRIRVCVVCRVSCVVCRVSCVVCRVVSCVFHGINRRL